MKLGITLIFLLVASAANATVTIRNFWNDLTPAKRSVVRLDTNGHALDVHDGAIVQDVNDPQWFHRLGTSYDCGRKWQHKSTPFCGFKSYKTKNFKIWYDNGFLFDASGAAWQARCVSAATYDGCFRPKVIYHSGSSKWKLWVNVVATAPKYVVLEGANLAGPFTEVGTVDLGAGGDMSLFRDDNGDGYLAYTDTGTGYDIKIIKLNSTYTGVSGSPVMVKDGTGGAFAYEAPAMFKKGGAYHIAYGHVCPYCANSDTTIMTNTGDPLSGTWTQGAALNTTSCGGQLGGVSKLSIDGADVYLVWTDLWKTANPADTTYLFGYRNQGQANFFENVLTFTGDVPNSYSCADTYQLALTDDAANNAPPGLQATSVADNYSTHCDLRGTTHRAQKFVATAAVNKLRILTFKSVQDGRPCDDTACVDISVDLRITVNSDSAGLPGSVLQTVDLPVASIKSAPRMYDVMLSSLPAGTYWYVMKPAASYTGNGAYCFGYNDGGGNYSAGAEAYSTNSGSSWSLEAHGNRDLLFQVIGTSPQTMPIDGGATSSTPAQR